MQKMEQPHPDEVLEELKEGQLAPAEAMRRLQVVRPVPLGPAPGGVRGASRQAVRGGGKEDAEAERRQRVEVILRELDHLVGLSSVKKLVREIQAYVFIQQKRVALGLTSDPTTLHMVFTGNPGTGKTTVARILGRLFKEMGVLTEGHFTEVERADLVGEYIGHTALKAREQVKKALGGVLFIDEAYSLARGGEKDFGKEAIDCLVAAMENHRRNLVVIFAGYPEEMEWFLDQNPGLRSRVPMRIEFPDYQPPELVQIAQGMWSERQYRLSTEANLFLRTLVERPEYRPLMQAGNGRWVRNLVERSLRSQAVRLVSKPSLTRDDLMTISKADLEEALVSL